VIGDLLQQHWRLQRALGFSNPHTRNVRRATSYFRATYAYNATERPEDAIRVAKSDFAKIPRTSYCAGDSLRIFHLKSYSEATVNIRRVSPVCGDSESHMAEKRRVAMNLGSTYGHWGTANRDAGWKKPKAGTKDTSLQALSSGRGIVCFDKSRFHHNVTSNL